MLLFLSVQAQQKFESAGQFSAWSLAAPGNEKQLLAGFRFLPGLRLTHQADALKLNAEASAYLFAHEALIPLDDHPSAGLQPYRFWIRLADSTRSLRLGLQQINFGSASLLRPLMWFDRLNPLDPLGITEGQWSALGQWYFGTQNNLWIWVNLPDGKARVWDLLPPKKYFPEAGGRFQWAVPKGEMGVAVNLGSSEPYSGALMDSGKGLLSYKFGLDGKWDLGPGLWYEFSLSGVNRHAGAVTHLAMITVGADYTFGLGNGLNVVAEQMFVAAGSRFQSMPEKTAFAATSLSYPLDFFNRFRLLAYYDWKNGKPYSFLQYEHTLTKGMLQLMAWANPESALLPGRDDLQIFGGTGVQCMYVIHF